jgi:hypothetical protein
MRSDQRTEDRKQKSQPRVRPLLHSTLPTLGRKLQLFFRKSTLPRPRPHHPHHPDSCHYRSPGGLLFVTRTELMCKAHGSKEKLDN